MLGLFVSSWSLVNFLYFVKLIFVRHGDTELNVNEYVQPFSNPLSASGILQAKDVAKRLDNYNIDLILSSPLPRTRDTANIINEAVQKDIIFNDLLAEVKWPTELVGKKLDDPKVVQYKRLRNENNIAGSDWHYSNEENFIDLKIRARSLLNELMGLKGENILAVSHSTFMKVVVSVMCHGDNVTWPVYFDILNFTRPKHTSISTFYPTNDGKWHLDGWNI